MATRFYLANTTVDSAVSGYTQQGGWNSTVANFVLRKATTVKGGSSVGVTGASGVTANQNRYAGLFLTAPLAAQSISGTVKGQIRASQVNATDDRCAQVTILVVSGDGTTVRGTLLAFDNTALSSEFALTNLTNRNFPRGGAITLTGVSPLAGDRIAIEVGLRRFSTNGGTTSFDFRDDSATDLAEDETTTAVDNSWIEFSATLSFQTGNPWYQYAQQ